MPRNVVFVAPFPAEVTMRFARAVARLPDVRLLGVVHTPPGGADAGLYHDLVRVTERQPDPGSIGTSPVATRHGAMRAIQPSGPDS